MTLTVSELMGYFTFYGFSSVLKYTICVAQIYGLQLTESMKKEIKNAPQLDFTPLDYFLFVNGKKYRILNFVETTDETKSGIYALMKNRKSFSVRLKSTNLNENFISLCKSGLINNYTPKYQKKEPHWGSFYNVALNRFLS